MNLDWWPTAQFLGQLEFAGTVFGAAFAVECLLPATRQRSWRALSFNLIAALIFIYIVCFAPIFTQGPDSIRKSA